MSLSDTLIVLVTYLLTSFAVEQIEQCPVIYKQNKMCARGEQATTRTSPPLCSPLIAKNRRAHVGVRAVTVALECGRVSVAAIWAGS